MKTFPHDAKFQSILNNVNFSEQFRTKQHIY